MNKSVSNYLLNDDASSFNKFLISNSNALLDGNNYLKAAKEKDAVFCVIALRLATEKFLDTALNSDVESFNESNHFFKILNLLHSNYILEVYMNLEKRKNLPTVTALENFEKAFTSKRLSLLKSFKTLGLSHLNKEEVLFIDNYLPLAVERLKKPLLKMLDVLAMKSKVEATAEAMIAIYLNDSSDYLSALYKVVSNLDPAGYRCLLKYSRESYEYTEKIRNDWDENFKYS